MNKIRNWYVVYTKAGQEQKVCEALRRKKMDSFYPVNKMIKLSYGRERVSFKPLIERYVFVYLADDEIEMIKEIKHIISFVHWLAKPVTVMVDDIYLLKRFFTMHDDIRLEKIKVNSAEQATISTELSGDDDSNDIVNFNFPALGYVMIAQVNKTRVKVITIPGVQTKTNFINKYAQAR